MPAVITEDPFVEPSDPNSTELIYPNMLDTVAEHEAGQHSSVGRQNSSIGLTTGATCHNQPATIVKAIKYWKRRFQLEGWPVNKPLPIEDPQLSFGSGSHLTWISKLKPARVPT